MTGYNFFYMIPCTDVDCKPADRGSPAIEGNFADSHVQDWTGAVRI